MLELKIDNGIAYYAGEAFITKKHAYPALGLLFTYQSTFEVIYDKKSITTYGAIIPPNLFHELIGAEGIIHFVCIEIEFKLAQKLIEFFNLKNNDVIPLKKLNFPIESSEIFDYSFFNRIFDFTFKSIPFAEIDPRIIKAIAYIKCNLSDEKISIKEVASHVCLSESRFAHLFKENISIPFRKYILWYRMRRAGKAIINGHNFTHAAYEGGFSDSAHFSRAFTSLFGISPSQLLKK